MTIRNKLLILLLIVSLVPLMTYFLLDVTFSHIARGYIEKTLKSALEARAEDTLVEIIDHYEETLKMSALAVRYALRHYAQQVQQSLWGVDVGVPLSSHPNLVWLSGEEPSKKVHKYRFVTATGSQEQEVDFGSQQLFSRQDDSQSLLLSRLPQLTETCKDIFSIHLESWVWIYTVLTDGTVALYPSVGSWPYETGYNFREQSWYIDARRNKQLTPTPRIEPLTGKSVMTVSMPLFEQDSSFAGIVALDIDLSGILERIEIPEEWQEGAWKLIIRLPEEQQWDANDVEVICCTTFTQSGVDLNRSVVLADMCDPQIIRAMVEDSRQGNTSSIRASCNGVDSLYVYGSSTGRIGFPVLIVPYQRIVEQANSTLQVLFRDNIRAIQVATVLILIAIITAVVLAAMRARAHTKPIYELTEASKRLAAGDYNARVNITTGDELQELGHIFNQTGPKLKEHAKMQRSLELAKAIQQNLLPKESPKLRNFDVAGWCQYCDETGGDYYDFIEFVDMEPGKLGIALGDVSGHGIGAALLMASARSILRSNAVRYNTNLSKLFKDVNDRLVKDTDDDKFMTLFYGILDDKSRKLVWASGGHDPALWYCRETDKIEELPNTGMPMGLMEDASFEQAGPVLLKSGDTVVVGTDGIWEAQDKDGNMFGKERLCRIISSEKGSAKEICLTVINSVTEFCGSVPQMDDITLIVVKVL